MNRTIKLDPKHLDILASIFSKHLPGNAKLFFFGSRSMGTHKPFSDIDILIDAGSSLSLKLLSILNQEFDTSLLPYKVDLVDANTISEAFKLAIHDQLIPFRYRTN